MSRSTRRGFLQQSAALGLGLTTSLGGRAMGPNDKISVACIGVRGRGNSVMQSFAAEPDCVVTHICDVNEPTRNQRGAEMKEKTGLLPKLVKDYRTLLEDPSVDVLMVATPDHWHALATIHGCLAGKDVYVEKPASHNIFEGKTAVAAAHGHNRIVQVGTQIRSAPFLREAVDYVRSGALGKVIFGRAWETDRNGEVHLGPNSEPPAELDYDLWQGPAPERPYNATIVGGAWRWLFDYGTGDLGNDGVHRIDYCRCLMGLEEMPQAIVCSGGKFFFEDDQEWPDTELVSFEYPGHILQYEMRLWSRPRLLNITEGAMVYGENGWILLTNNSWKAYDAAGKVVQEGEGNSAQTQQLHIRNFLDAVRSRDRASLNQEIRSGHISSVMCHAGNIAWRTGKKLRFDPLTETFDDAEANQYVGREHRRGYELPDVT
jgi:predicted dehydrogenase